MRGMNGRGVALSALMLAGLAMPALAQESAPAGDAVSRAQIDRYIEDWVRANPDVVVEVLTKYSQDQRKKQEEEQSKAAVDIAPMILANADAPYGGNPQGTETIIEFMDYRCGYCKRMDPVLTELVAERPNLKIVFVESPVLGPQSELAARAALAVKTMDAAKYYDYHRALYALPDLTIDLLKAEAAKLNLDADKMEATMKSPEVEKELAWSRDMQQKAGVRGTPFFIVGKDDVLPGAVDKAALTQALTN